MENFIHLLQVKSVNYESDRVDNLKPSITAQDVLLAMSFAQLTPLQDNLIRLKCLGANTLQNIDAFSKVLLECFVNRFEKLSTEYHLVVIRVALIEFCAVPADYNPSSRNRAILCGYSHVTVKNRLSNWINLLREEFETSFRIAEMKISYQLKKEPVRY